MVSGPPTAALRDLDLLLAGMRPSLQPGRYAFTTLPPGQALDPAHVIASIREAEGRSVVLEEADALALGLPIAFTAAWICACVAVEGSVIVVAPLKESENVARGCAFTAVRLIDCTSLIATSPPVTSVTTNGVEKPNCTCAPGWSR